MGVMVERCANCGKVLYPDRMLTAYSGLLFCSSKCCTGYAYTKAVLLENPLLMNDTRHIEMFKEAERVTLEESEELRGSDIGLTYPVCPFTNNVCNDSCAVRIGDYCALIKIAEGMG